MLYTKVVTKLVLILSEQTCNTIYQISNKARIFCSALSQIHTSD